MVLKTFNVHEEVHRKFSDFCKERGVSMSKQIEWFMESMVAKDKEVKKEYLDKLERIKRGKYHKFSSISELREMIEG
jgi:hypothetical protein